MKQWFSASLLVMVFFLMLGVYGAEEVIYENDFSDASTLSDFSEYRHAWEIKDGALHAGNTTLDGSVTDGFSHIIYSAGPTLTDYIAEVDYLNAVNSGGLIFNADINRVTHGRNGICGYLAFGASTGDKGAFGYGTANGTWGGNIHVGAVAFEKGTDLHIKVTVKGDYVLIQISDIATGMLVYTYIYSIGANAAHTAWRGGAVGLRLDGTEGCFDNFKITTANEVAIPSDIPAERFGEGISFGPNTGRYRFAEALPAMPCTFEATMYFPYNMTSDYTHIILSNFQCPQTGFLFEITKGGNPSIMFYDENDVRTRYTFSSVSVYNGKKTHIAITADTVAGKISCYADGVLEQMMDLTVDPADFSTDFTVLGTDNREINLNLFRGALINLACYADVRTAEEIKADMTAPGADGLILHFDLYAANYGEDAVDLSATGDHAVYEAFWLDEIDNITDYAYSVAVVGDTQHNVQYQPVTFAKLYDWLAANKESKKMAFMLGLGDITNDNTDEQWGYAIENFAKLDGILPYALCRGNHDGTAADYSSRFEGTGYASAVDGSYFKTRANSYRKFKVGNINYLVITLNYNPGDDELAWAKRVADENPYDRVIAITHSSLRADAAYNAHGKNIWNKFAKLCPNVEMVLSGHVFNDKILCVEDRGVAGNLVKQIMINGQCVDCMRIYDGKEAAGLVAMFYFDKDGRNLKVEYYSTALDKYFMECNQFETTLGNMPGDADFDGRTTLKDTMLMLKSVLDGKVCYNGDVSGDSALTLTDVLQTFKYLSM